MRHTSLGGLTIGSAIAVLCVLNGQQPGLAAPTSMYAVNNFQGDRYNQNAVALCWKRLGFMDANGKPATLTQDRLDDRYLVKLDDVVVGGYNTFDGAPYKFFNVDRSKELWDLSSGAKFNDMWSGVDPKGTIEILKHGLRMEDRPPGGGIVLNNDVPFSVKGSEGFWFNGFTLTPAQGQQPGSGTGAMADAKAYQLPARDGAEIKMVLTICYGKASTNVGNGPCPSVADTLAAIPGVKSVSGYDGACTVAWDFDYTGGTAAQQKQGIDTLATRARKHGWRITDNGGAVIPAKLLDYLRAFNSLDRYAVLRAAFPNAVTVKSIFSEPTAARPLADDSVTTPDGSEMPLVISSSGGHYLYDDGLSGEPEAGINVHPGTASGMVTLNAYQYAELEGDPSDPFGLAAASRPTLFSADAVDPMSPTSLLSAITLELPYDTEMLSPQLYQLDTSGSGWIPTSGAQFDSITGLATFDTTQMGVYQVFGLAVPEPGAAGLLVIVAWSLQRPRH